MWVDDHVHGTTAGPRWTRGALAVFVSSEPTWFSLRTAWGRRLLVDLDGGVSCEAQSLAPEVLARIAGEERRRALAILDAVAPEEPARPDPVPGALGVVVAQQLVEALPALRVHERRWGVWSTTGSHVLGDRFHAEEHRNRALARLAIRTLGAEPDPGGNYTFVSGFYDPAPRLLEGTAAPVAAWDVARTLRLGATGREVLERAGPPDHARHLSRELDGRGYVWSELWDYDGPETTTRLVWSFPKNGRRPRLRLERIEELPAGWRDPERWHALAS